MLYDLGTGSVYWIDGEGKLARDLFDPSYVERINVLVTGSPIAGGFLMPDFKVKDHRDEERLILLAEERIPYDIGEVNLDFEDIEGGIFVGWAKAIEIDRLKERFGEAFFNISIVPREYVLLRSFEYLKKLGFIFENDVIFDVIGPYVTVTIHGGSLKGIFCLDRIATDSLSDSQAILGKLLDRYVEIDKFKAYLMNYVTSSLFVRDLLKLFPNVVFFEETIDLLKDMEFNENRPYSYFLALRDLVERGGIFGKDEKDSES